MRWRSQIGPGYQRATSLFDEVDKDYSVLEFVLYSICEPGLQHRLLHSSDQAVRKFVNTNANKDQNLQRPESYRR